MKHKCLPAQRLNCLWKQRLDKKNKKKNLTIIHTQTYCMRGNPIKNRIYL